MEKRSAKREIVLSLAVLAACGALYLLPEPPHPLGEAGETALATVLETDESDIRQHGLVPAGSQRLTVEVRDGRLAGRRFRAGNELRGQLELDKLFRPGDAAVVTLPPGEVPEDAVLTARDHYRFGWELVLFGGFCVLLCVFGSWDIRREHTIVADFYLRNVDNSAVIVCEKLLADFNIKTVVAVKRRIDKGLIRLTEQLFDNFLYSVKIGTVHKIELL